MPYIIAFFFVSLACLVGYWAGFAEALRPLRIADPRPVFIMPHPDDYETLKRHGARYAGELRRTASVIQSPAWKAAMEKLAATIRDFARGLGGTD